MTHHPMVPTNEQLKKWENAYFDHDENLDVLLIQVYQEGADAELEACYLWVADNFGEGPGANLLQFRRPKPPSLKKQALDLLDKAEDPSWDINDFSIVREALEQLND